MYAASCSFILNVCHSFWMLHTLFLINDAIHCTLGGGGILLWWGYCDDEVEVSGHHQHQGGVSGFLKTNRCCLKPVLDLKVKRPGCLISRRSVVLGVWSRESQQSLVYDLKVCSGWCMVSQRSADMVKTECGGQQTMVFWIHWRSVDHGVWSSEGQLSLVYDLPKVSRHR